MLLQKKGDTKIEGDRNLIMSEFSTLCFSLLLQNRLKIKELQWCLDQADNYIKLIELEDNDINIDRVDALIEAILKQ